MLFLPLWPRLEHLDAGHGRIIRTRRGPQESVGGRARRSRFPPSPQPIRARPRARPPFLVRLPQKQKMVRLQENQRYGFPLPALSEIKRSTRSCSRTLHRLQNIGLGLASLDGHLESSFPSLLLLFFLLIRLLLILIVLPPSSSRPGSSCTLVKASWSGLTLLSCRAL